jgi:hypothetical protein
MITASGTSTVTAQVINKATFFDFMSSPDSDEAHQAIKYFLNALY